MNITLRALRLPEDYEAIARLLNTVWSEPSTADSLHEADEKLYEVGHTWMDENGLLAGYDRERRVAVTEDGEIIGYAWSWRAPWTEPGYLCNTLVVAEACRNRGAGKLLLRHMAEWASGLGASAMLAEVWDDNEAAIGFARRRGFVIERHAYQSLLRLGGDNERLERALSGFTEPPGIRFLTLADEPGENSERKLFRVYEESMRDIPSFLGDMPDFNEWRKWYLQVDGYAPERVIIAADGDRFVGLTNVLLNAQTGGMYHEYTGVSRDYRGRGIGSALKVRAVRLAQDKGAAYIRTDNDSLNEPILKINRKLGYEPLRGAYRIVAPLEHVLQSFDVMENIP
ncbi:GNAT family N-acetyltransferase [Paenibacillus arenilitoris]|uniref:GNAT family N-acetyltransferase n=1 Tax=Paenibacillus arenilitoris TaxID=2772299 RepID=A0A927CP72_9BACL|nr:GNAT family N-acetyltransferase [Paenibacillus arenilitoris]MBD2871619.1 GNAT family N-acetyltransferase [Paenibacillus arenilitoris]